jgi:hypothetical protein
VVGGGDRQRGGRRSGRAGAGQRLAPLLDGIDDSYLHAVTRLAMAWISPIVDDFDGALRAASVSLEQLRGQDEPFWTALALATLGFQETAVGRYDDAIGHLTVQRDLGSSSTMPGSPLAPGCSWAPWRSRRAGWTTRGHDAPVSVRQSATGRAQR